MPFYILYSHYFITLKKAHLMFSHITICCPHLCYFDFCNVHQYYHCMFKQYVIQCLQFIKNVDFANCSTNWVEVMELHSAIIVQCQFWNDELGVLYFEGLNCKICNGDVESWAIWALFAMQYQLQTITVKVISKNQTSHYLCVWMVLVVEPSKFNILMF